MEPTHRHLRRAAAQPSVRGRAHVLFAIAGLALPATACRIDSHAPSRAIDPAVLEQPPLIGLRSVVYPVTDLVAAREWYRRALEIDPYFDGSSYVGFRLGEYELGLDPDTARIALAAAGGVAYWAVADIEREVQRLIQLGATPHTPVRSARDGLRLAVLLDPFGNAIGLVHDSASGGTP